jgi:hypothetical protein
MLFAMIPATLDRYGLISGPPCVADNSTVFVFLIQSIHTDRVPGTDRRPVPFGSAPILHPSFDCIHNDELEAAWSFQASRI